MVQKIRQEEIYHFAGKSLFIRGAITKPSKNGLDKAKIYILSGLSVAKGVCLNYVEYRYTYGQLKNGSRDFVSHLEQNVFAPDDYIDTLGVLRIWGLKAEVFEEMKPEIIITGIKETDPIFVGGSIQRTIPMTDPAVIAHLARFHGMIGQTHDPQNIDLGREQVYLRLGALISQQLKKWSQMVG